MRRVIRGSESGRQQTQPRSTGRGARSAPGKTGTFPTTKRVSRFSPESEEQGRRRRFGDDTRSRMGKTLRVPRFSDEEKGEGAARPRSRASAGSSAPEAKRASRTSRLSAPVQRRFQRNDEHSPGRKRYDSAEPKKRLSRNKPTFSERENPTGGAHFARTHLEDEPRRLRRKSAAADSGLMRLNRFIANAGICSRREADTYIAAGVVTVNGKIVTELGTKVLPTDDVRFDGNQLVPERKVYLLLNKPKDVVTTTDDPHAEQTVMDMVKDACQERIYPVGRLDKNTTGLLLMTNDGELSKRLTHPSHQVDKVYQVTLDKNVSVGDMKKIADGVELDDGLIAADAISYIEGQNKNVVGIEIHSGRNRVVRRIFEHLGYRVKALDRVSFAGLTKKKLPRGKWRFLSPQEVNFLKMK